MAVTYRSQAWRRLGAALLIVVAIWGVVLPRIERTHFVRQRITHLKRHGIDPAAFFYTDHEGMNRWEAESRTILKRGPTQDSPVPPAKKMFTRD